VRVHNATVAVLLEPMNEATTTNFNLRAEGMLQLPATSMRAGLLRDKVFNMTSVRVQDDRLQTLFWCQGHQNNQLRWRANMHMPVWDQW
jgi:hypothetical protein